MLMMLIFMVFAKLVAPGPLKLRVSWNEGYDIITFVYDVINKILWRDVNHIVNLDVTKGV